MEGGLGFDFKVLRVGSWFSGGPRVRVQGLQLESEGVDPCYSFNCAGVLGEGVGFDFVEPELRRRYSAWFALTL